MALTSRNKQHRKQILAGTIGRNKGHTFEADLVAQINSFSLSSIRSFANIDTKKVLFNGNPANLLLQYILAEEKIDLNQVDSINAFWLGGLATSGKGDVMTHSDGKNVKSSKSDVLLRITFKNKKVTDIGISVKTCSNTTPTNDQLFFTTASAFCNLLRNNGISVSPGAERALKMFCGDVGLRPTDSGNVKNRKSDPDRWFWEELPKQERGELEKVLLEKQDEITEVLFKKAYPNDPFPPRFVMHQTKKYTDPAHIEVALFAIPRLIRLSRKFSGFELRPYSVKKGRFRGDPNIHLAPRFGIVQMQRGGQKQHPTQLQFNLKAGYFYHLENLS